MIIASCALLLLAAGCKNNDKDKDKEPESIIGTTDQPAWAVPAEYDMTSSMTAIVKVDLSSTYTAEQLSAAHWQYADDDLLAAFCGENCLGVGVYQQEYGAYWLYIAAPENGDRVTLKHYSATLKNIFVASEALPFTNDANLGSAAQPYTPAWTLVK